MAAPHLPALFLPWIPDSSSEGPRAHLCSTFRLPASQKLLVPGLAQTTRYLATDSMKLHIHSWSSLLSFFSSLIWVPFLMTGFPKVLDTSL